MSQLDLRKRTKCEPNENIRVFVRIRPNNKADTANPSGSSPVLECTSDHNIFLKEKSIMKTFAFDRVFAPTSTQIDVYEIVVNPLIDEVLSGYNCTVLAYGQTGTGKTYTMEGKHFSADSTWEKDPHCGIVPRVLRQIFEKLRMEQVQFTVRVSFVELYNEDVIDLLSSVDDTTKLRLFEDATQKGSVVIQGLSEVLVLDEKELYPILSKGTHKRRTAATAMNAHSSRSHTIFSIVVHIRESTDDAEVLFRTGKINLVDLAGSENVGRSGAKEQRAREASCINKSILTLGRVISSLIENTTHIPYRESKLTRLLQDSLGGKTKTSIIATVSPLLENLEETISTLEYAQRAKSITNRPEINQRLPKKEDKKDTEDTKSENSEVDMCKAEVCSLQLELSAEKAASHDLRMKLETIEAEMKQKDQYWQQIEEQANAKEETSAKAFIELQNDHEKCLLQLDEVTKKAQLLEKSAKKYQKRSIALEAKLAEQNQECEAFKDVALCLVNDTAPPRTSATPLLGALVSTFQRLKEKQEEKATAEKISNMPDVNVTPDQNITLHEEYKTPPEN